MSETAELIEQQQKQINPCTHNTIYPNTTPREQHQYLQNLLLAHKQQILANHIWAQNTIAQQRLIAATLQFAPQQALPPQTVHQQSIPERATLNLPFISKVRLQVSPTPMPLDEKLFQLQPDDPCLLKGLRTPQKHLEETRLEPFQDANQMNQDIVQQKTSVYSMEHSSASFQQHEHFHADLQEEEQIHRMENINSITVGLEQTTLPNPSKPIDVTLWKSVFGEEYVGMANVPRFEIIKLHDLLVLASKIVETSSFDYVENMSSFTNSDLLNRIKLIANTINLGINVVQFINTYGKQPEVENNLMETIFTPRYGNEKVSTAVEEDGYLNYTPSPATLSHSTTPDSSHIETPHNSQYDRVASTCSINQTMSSMQTLVNETPEPYQEVMSAEQVTEQVGEVQVAQIKKPVGGEPLLKKIRLTNDSRVPFTSSVEQVMTNTSVHVSENHNSSQLCHSQESPKTYQEVISAEPVTEQVGEVQVAQIKEPVEGEPLLTKIRLTNDSLVPFTSSVEQAMTNTSVHVSENHNSSLLHCSQESPEPYEKAVSAKPVTEQVGEVQAALIKETVEEEPILKKVRLTNDSLVPPTSSVKQVVTNSCVHVSQNYDLSQLHRSQGTPELNKKLGSAKSSTEEQIDEGEIDVTMDGKPLLRKINLTTDNLIQVPATPVIESSSAVDQSGLKDVEMTSQANQADPTTTSQDHTLQCQTRVPETQNSIIAQMRETMKTLPEEMQHKFSQILHLIAVEYSKKDPPKVSEFFDMLIILCKEGRL